MAQRRGQARASGEREPLGTRWEGNAQEAFLGLREWRALHPKATLGEIEIELDQRMAVMRAQILADLALASEARELQAGEPPCCPTCGAQLRGAGRHARRLVTLGNQVLTLEREYATCPACGVAFSPWTWNWDCCRTSPGLHDERQRSAAWANW